MSTVPTIHQGQNFTAGDFLYTPTLGKLAAVLSKALQKCEAVKKGATNTYHNYKYASSESIIEEGNRLLGSCGLCLIPAAQHIDFGSTPVVMTRRFILVDSSGECIDLFTTWPVIPDKGRPLDKATAAAATVSLSYLLRDLLLMARVNEGDEVDARDDRDHDPQRRSNGNNYAPSDSAIHEMEPETEKSAAHREALLTALYKIADDPDPGKQAFALRTDWKAEAERLKPEMLQADLDRVTERWKALWKDIREREAKPAPAST